MAQLRNTSISDTGFLQIPQGTTAQRPASPQAGMIRYNTTIQDTEYYDGSVWRPIADNHPEATGGTIIDTEIGGVPYRIHLFTNTGNTNFVVTKGGEAEYLIVAGGGAGGSGRHGAGGGAGGLLTGFTTITPQTYTITVGAGGTAAASNGDGAVGNGSAGGNSSAFGLTAIGGGVGGGHPGPTESGGSGGSGGGGAHGNTTGGTGTAGQGNSGTGATNRARNGAGGGAGGAPLAGFGGETDFSGRADDGGPGIFSLILPPGYFFAGGGGGSASPSDGNGDLWIGGNGGPGGGGGGATSARLGASRGGDGGPGYNNGGNGAKEVRTGATGVCNGGNGGANTGGGGGGAAGWGSIGNGRGGNGGSGIVIVRYRRNTSTLTAPTFIRQGVLGETPQNPANSAQEILRYNGAVPDGIYYINLPDVGVTPVYCLMNPAFKGGGWMLAMKATRGDTFNYDSNLWTTNNTLNATTQLNLQDADAKFEVFNRFRATEIFARFPDVSAGGTMMSIGGSTTQTLGGWTWDEKLPYSPISLTNFFATCPRTYLLESDEIFNWRGHGNNGPFSAQSVWRKYGFNNNIGNGRSRWGFTWNENAPDDPNSQDVAGGIGTAGLGSGSMSAGDRINCCQSYSGVNRTMRVEIYVR